MNEVLMTKIPDDYWRYIAQLACRKGFLNIEPGWFQLWDSAEIIGQNEGYSLPELIPGYIAFGSSGSGEIFAFDRQHQVLLFSLSQLEPGAGRVIARSWSGFRAIIEASAAVHAQPGHNSAVLQDIQNPMIVAASKSRRKEERCPI
jgi:hypothetical protein